MIASDPPETIYYLPALGLHCNISVLHCNVFVLRCNIYIPNHLLIAGMDSEFESCGALVLSGLWDRSNTVSPSQGNHKMGFWENESKNPNQL
ncbi:MAG: hypothetical protein HQL52_09980 [Magnetococcales bacterium]|nr:hypothetical protein [Magnetococcales bacterium]